MRQTTKGKRHKNGTHSKIKPQTRASDRKLYIPVKNKFTISIILGLIWTVFSVYFSIPWLKDLSVYISLPAAILVISGIAYIPGYFNAFMVSSLLLDRQPKIKISSPKEPVTVLIACYNEEEGVEDTVKYVAAQDYEGEIRIIVIDNNSTDKTSEVAKIAGEKLNVNLSVLFEKKPGKNFALNAALEHVETKYVLTLDADTLLHKSAIRNIVSRIESSPKDVCAVAGTVLVRNSRGNLLARIQEWDYFLGIASIKRLQGLFQSTLVAQGAFSLYRTEIVKMVGGWPDAIGEDIVLTWGFLKNNFRVYFEPLAVAFTDVPTTFKHFFRQRSRWARGMVEALKLFKPWTQPIYSARYLTSCNLFMPFMDFVYTFCWLPGLVLALFGHYWIVGPTTLFVIPLALLQNYILYSYQKGVFKSLNLRVRKNAVGFILYVLCYQVLMSPISVWGYIQETLKLRRIWK